MEIPNKVSINIAAAKEREERSVDYKVDVHS